MNTTTDGIIYGPIAGPTYYAIENRLKRAVQVAWLRQLNTAEAAMRLQTVEAWEADRKARNAWEHAQRKLSAHERTF